MPPEQAAMDAGDRLRSWLRRRGIPIAAPTTVQKRGGLTPWPNRVEGQTVLRFHGLSLLPSFHDIPGYLTSILVGTVFRPCLLCRWK